jgi:hypothetical protein
MPTSDERELILKAYCELGQIERSHSNTQTSYRTLASTWMFAKVMKRKTSTTPTFEDPVLGRAE